MVPLKIHNILDYVAGVLLLFVPALFGFSEIDAARNLFIFAGVFLIAYSLITKYYYSLLKIIPLGVHMALDVASGVVVMLAPWVLGYRDLLTGGQEIVHYVLGVGVIGLVAMTRSKTESDKIREEPAFPGRFSTTGRS